MSKSEGNFYTVRELLEKGFEGDVIRLYLISTHYRTESDFKLEGLEKAEKELEKVRTTIQKIQKNPGEDDLDSDEIEEKFEDEMDDDLNTARAKQELMGYIGDVNSSIENGAQPSEEVADTIEELFGILGVDVNPEVSKTESGLADTLLELRDEARKDEDWETADLIRDRLKELGFQIEDNEDGSQWLKG